MSVVAEAGTSSSQEASVRSAAHPQHSDERFRLERLSWFGLVGVLVVTGVLPDWLSLHNGATPLAAGLVLLATAFMEIRRTSTRTISHWIAGILLLLIAGFNFASRPQHDLSLLVVAVAIILIGRSAFTRNRS